MRANPAEYELVSPGSLHAVLHLLAQSPGQYTPIAGGTELMVAFAAGRLQPRKFVSIHGLPELTAITLTPEEITLGAGVTYTTIRNHPELAPAFPLLVRAASWTGSIANQNRGTLGGNLVNASPAADTPPALLVYDATVTLLSATGARTLPYTDFHLGYKQTALRPDELLHSISIPCNWSSHKTYLRKVGTRNAQAISKVVLAATAQTSVTKTDHPESSVTTIDQIRLAAASVADRPLRLHATEAALLYQPLTPATIAQARKALLAEVHPIDDIRSTADYRSTVAANLLEDFLTSLA